MTGPSAGAHRLPPRPGEVIERSHEVGVTVDGLSLAGYEGDTAASLLTAHSRRAFFGSLHEQRPGGVRTADRFDRDAWVWVAGEGLVPAAGYMVRPGDRLAGYKRRASTPSATTPIVRWQHVGRSAVERLAPRTATTVPPWLASMRRGEGRVVAEPARRACVDVVVVGGGPAGLAAARAAADAGATVALVEADGWLGGSLRWSGPVDEQAGAAEAAAALSARDEVEVLCSAVASETRPDGTVVVVERRGPAERVVVLHGAAIVLATGAADRVLPFSGNHLPGVMTPAGVRRLVGLWAVRPGRMALLVADRPGEAEATALSSELAAAGVGVAGVEVFRDGAAHLAVDGGHEVEEVHLPNGRRIEADLLVASFGSQVETALVRGLGGVVTRLAATAQLVLGNLPVTVAVVGAAAGATSTERAVADGTAAGARMARLAAGADGRTRVAPPSAPVVVAGTAPSVPRPVSGLLDAGLDLRVEALAGSTASLPVAMERLVGAARRHGLGLAARTVLADLAGSNPVSASLVELVLAADGPLDGPSLGALAELDRPVLRSSPLVDLHRRAGARFVPSDGWSDVLDYGDVDRELDALAVGVGLRDVSCQAWFEITGPQAAAVVAEVFGAPAVQQAVDEVCTIAAPLQRAGAAAERLGGSLHSADSERDPLADPPLGRGAAPIAGVGHVAGNAVVAARSVSRGALEPSQAAPPEPGREVIRVGPSTWQVSAPEGCAADLERELLMARLRFDPWQVVVTPANEDAVRVRVCGPAAEDLLRGFGLELDLAAHVGRRVPYTVEDLAGVIVVRNEDDAELRVSADSGRALWAALLVAGERLAVCPVGIDAMDRRRAGAL